MTTLLTVLSGVSSIAAVVLFFLLKRALKQQGKAEKMMDDALGLASKRKADVADLRAKLAQCQEVLANVKKKYRSKMSAADLAIDFNDVMRSDKTPSDS